MKRDITEKRYRTLRGFKKAMARYKNSVIYWYTNDHYYVILLRG